MGGSLSYVPRVVSPLLSRFACLDDKLNWIIKHTEGDAVSVAAGLKPQDVRHFPH